MNHRKMAEYFPYSCLWIIFFSELSSFLYILYYTSIWLLIICYYSCSNTSYFSGKVVTCWYYWVLWLEVYKCLEWGNILWKSRWSCHGNVSNLFFIPLFLLLERFKIWLFLAVDLEKTRIALETLFMEFTAVSWWKLHNVIKSISSIYL